MRADYFFFSPTADPLSNLSLGRSSRRSAKSLLFPDAIGIFIGLGLIMMGSDF